MARINLNAKRAARTEAQNEPHELVLGFDEQGNEQVFLLRPWMPMELPPLLREARFDEAMKLLLVNPDDWEQLRKAVPEDSDWPDISALYAVDPGESPASRRSSKNGGSSSRRTSSASTKSTSAKPAGARRPSASDGSTP